MQLWRSNCLPLFSKPAGITRAIMLSSAHGFPTMTPVSTTLSGCAGQPVLCARFAGPPGTGGWATGGSGVNAVGVAYR